jgi:hypothetical protein
VVFAQAVLGAHSPLLLGGFEGRRKKKVKGYEASSEDIR